MSDERLVFSEDITWGDDEPLTEAEQLEIAAARRVLAKYSSVKLPEHIWGWRA